MDTVLRINGMHCAACVALVTMELEEVGLSNKVTNLSILDDNKGELELKDVTPEDIALAKSTINTMDSYSID